MAHSQLIYLQANHWEWPSWICDLPIFKMVISHGYVSLPEGDVDVHEWLSGTRLMGFNWIEWDISTQELWFHAILMGFNGDIRNQLYGWVTINGKSMGYEFNAPQCHQTWLTGKSLNWPRGFQLWTIIESSIWMMDFPASHVWLLDGRSNIRPTWEHSSKQSCF